METMVIVIGVNIVAIIFNVGYTMAQFKDIKELTKKLDCTINGNGQQGLKERISIIETNCEQCVGK